MDVEVDDTLMSGRRRRRHLLLLLLRGLFGAKHIQLRVGAE